MNQSNRPLSGKVDLRDHLRMSILSKLLRPSRHQRLGYFEGRRGRWVSGWTFDPHNPHEPLIVRLTGNDRAAIEVVADRHRADVQKAKSGTGYCGFRIPAESFLDCRQMHCAWADTGIALPGSPSDAIEASRQQRIQRGPLLLILDAVVTGEARLSGYLHDSESPHRRARLGLYDGTTVIVQTRSCRYRIDAAELSGDGFKGFSLGCPQLWNARLDLVDLDRDLCLIQLR